MQLVPTMDGGRKVPGLPDPPPNDQPSDPHVGQVPQLPVHPCLESQENFPTTAVCPKLEELVLHITEEDQFCIKELSEMAKVRVSSGVKVSTVDTISSSEIAPAKEVLKLREYVSRVEYRLDDVVPEWDAIPADDDTDDESDW